MAMFTDPNAGESLDVGPPRARARGAGSDPATETPGQGFKRRGFWAVSAILGVNAGLCSPGRCLYERAALLGLAEGKTAFAVVRITDVRFSG